MITLEGLRKDILRLQTLVVSQGERIAELEGDARPAPMPPKECAKCEGRGYIKIVESAGISQFICPKCRGGG